MNADSAFYHSVAFGPRGIAVHIADHCCRVRRCGCQWEVQDDREAIHSFSGLEYDYDAVLGSMADYFSIVDGGR